MGVKLAASVVVKTAATVLAGVLVGGVVATRAVDSDTTSKGLFAEIDQVMPTDGGKGIGRAIRVSGSATATVPAGFEMRYAVRGVSFWYPSIRALQVVDSAWEFDDSLGNQVETGLFTLSIVFGKTTDIAAWIGAKVDGRDGVADDPVQYGLYVLADRQVRRVR